MPLTAPDDLQWLWRHFDLHSVAEWHEILTLRAAVFVVEQDCPYCDPDHKDVLSYHLQARRGGQLIGTARAIPPGVSYADASIGRVVVAGDARGLQMGRLLMERAIEFCQSQWPTAIRISGQSHLQKFYESLGFDTVRGPYDEDGIPHFEMLRPAVQHKEASAHA